MALAARETFANSDYEILEECYDPNFEPTEKGQSVPVVYRLSRLPIIVSMASMRLSVRARFSALLATLWM